MLTLVCRDLLQVMTIVVGHVGPRRFLLIWCAASRRGSNPLQAAFVSPDLPDIWKCVEALWQSQLGLAINWKWGQTCTHSRKASIIYILTLSSFIKVGKKNEWYFVIPCFTHTAEDGGLSETYACASMTSVVTEISVFTHAEHSTHTHTDIQLQNTYACSTGQVAA